MQENACRCISLKKTLVSIDVNNVVKKVMKGVASFRQIRDFASVDLACEQASR